MNIRPLPSRTIRSAGLSPWQDGSLKPAKDGLYLRQFDEGEANSTFLNGKWRYDGFFESDIQNAPWRGLAAESSPAGHTSEG